MTRQHAKLPTNVLAAIEQGRLIEAIKLLRETREMTLKEAKDRIDAEVLHRNVIEPSRGTTTRFNMPASVIAALRKGSKIEAIKLLRAQTGWDLAATKHSIDDYLAGHASELPLARRQPEAVQSDKGGVGRIAMVIIAVLVAILWWRHGL